PLRGEMPAVNVNDPARILTTHGFVTGAQATPFTCAPLTAAAMVAALTVPDPPGASALQAALLQLGQLAEGIPPCTPARDQSVARLEAMIPDHSWVYPDAGKQSRMKKNSSEYLCLISSPKSVPTSDIEQMRIAQKRFILPLEYLNFVTF